MDIETLKVVIPAVIGASVAIIVFILKDIILYWYRTNKQRKMELLDRKLTELYGPLFITMYAGEGMLGNIFSDKATYEKLITNMHLLSPKLFILINEFLVEFDYKTGKIPLHKSDRYTELSKNFNTLLINDIEKLRHEWQNE